MNGDLDSSECDDGMGELVGWIGAIGSMNFKSDTDQVVSLTSLSDGYNANVNCVGLMMEYALESSCKNGIGGIRFGSRNC